MPSRKLVILLLLSLAAITACTSVSPVPVQMACPKLPPADPSIMQTVAPHWMSDLQAFSTTNSRPQTSLPNNSPQPSK